MENRKGKKVAANAIPEFLIDRFRYKLEELSGTLKGQEDVNEYLKERNIMLFDFGISTGYRMEDLVDLTIGKIREFLDEGKITIQEKKQYKSWVTRINKNPMSKEKKPDVRIVYIPTKLEKTLRKYVKGKKSSEYAFKSHKRNSYIEASSFSDILKEVATELDLDDITGHSLRKTYATILLNRTGKLDYVSDMLGHKSIEQTRRYLKLKENSIKDAAKILNSIL